MAGVTEPAALSAAASVSATAAAGYQLLGPQLSDPALAAQARADQQAQLDARDAALTLLAALGPTPPAGAPSTTGTTAPTVPAAGLTLPNRVADQPAALRLAAELEEASADAWRVLLDAAARGSGADARPMREGALTQLRLAAVRGSRWRIAAGGPASNPFPGIPA